MKKLFLLSAMAVLALFSCQPNPVGGVIEGTNWVLVSIKQNGKNLAVSKNTKTTLQFGEEKLNGTGPCNSFHGNFSPNGVTLAVTDIASTKRMCDEMDEENNFLGLLGKAVSYSVLKDKLEIFSENGQLTFAPLSEAEINETAKKEGLNRLSALFPQMEGDLMPHIYPILNVDNPGTYPYLGTLVDTAFYQYFDEETSLNWRTTGGEVSAIGKFGDFYICRVPGRYVSSDIALFRVENNALKRSETVAWAWCDEGWCMQQDAWFLDVDKDGKLDLVQRYNLKDERGKLQEERLSVMLQDESGNFKPSEGFGLDKTKFEMAKL